MPNVMAALPNTGGALCSMLQFGWCTLLDCCAVTLPRRKSHWNKLGCPKLVNRSQSLVGQTSPYCGNIWRTYCYLTSFFPIINMCLSCEDIARQSFAMVPRCRFLGTFFAPCIFSEPCAARFRPASQIRTKATPCVEVCQTSNLWRLRLGKEKR